MAQTAKRATIAVYDGQVVISDIVKSKTTVPIYSSNETYSATLVTSWYDGSPMDDTKADGSVYFKLKALPQGADPDIYGQYVGSYFRVNLPKFGETFLEKDTMQAMRDLSPVEVLLLKMGYYKGVKLNGYYAKNDTPVPIEYYLSETTEEDNGVSVISGEGYKLFHDFNGLLNVLYAGASQNLTKEENKSIIDNSITILDNQGGGEVKIPSSINYGYRRQYIETHPQQNGLLINDVVVYDESIGNTYTSNPTVQRDGAQTRKFYMVKGDVTNGQSDGQGDIIRGDWHPYLFISNDKDPLLAQRRHATIFFGYNGHTVWGVGQGIAGTAPDGTDRDLQMADFKIVCSKIEGVEGLTTMMAIKLATGRFGFNTNSPTADYHFMCNRNGSTPNASFMIQNFKDGVLTFILKTKNKQRNIQLNEATGDLLITNDTGSGQVFKITPNGSIESGGMGIINGVGAPNGVVTAKIGSIYMRTDAGSNDVGIYIKSQGSGNTGWVQLRGVKASATDLSITGLDVGSTYFNTTDKMLKVFDGTSWLNTVPNATASVKGIVNQAIAQADISQADLVAISTADGSDATTTQDLANAIKAYINANVVPLVNALKSSQNTELVNQRTAGQQATT